MWNSPPGSGKTALLAAQVRNLRKVYPDARFLLTSETNVAIGKMAEEYAAQAGAGMDLLVLTSESCELKSGGQTDPVLQRFGLVAHLEYLVKVTLGNRVENAARANAGLVELGLPLDEDQVGKAQSYLYAKKRPELVQLDDSAMVRLVLTCNQEVRVLAATLGLVFANMDIAKVEVFCLDEASQTTEAEAVALASLSTARLALLVGDTHQMAPYVPLGLEPFVPYGMRSVLEVTVGRGIAMTCDLEFQYRSEPSIFRCWNVAGYDGR